MYMEGSEIDFVDSLMGAGFTVHNPNAVSTCGCGHSFRTEEGGEAEAHSGGCLLWVKTPLGSREGREAGRNTRPSI
jgi:hypothetical protein